MSAMNELIKSLRSALKRGEISMSALAREAGCTRQHLYGVLDGRHQLSLNMAEKLAAVIGFQLVMKRARRKISA